MTTEPRRFSFEAIFADDAEIRHVDYSVVAVSQAQAWEIATGAAQEGAIKKRCILVAMSYLGWGEISEPAPFEAPYIIDSPLWGMELSRKT